MKEQTAISVIVPVYGCPEALPELHSRLVVVLEKLVSSFEIVLIDDGCPSDSWGVMKKIAFGDKRVRCFRLSRNFGQHRAITTGLDIVRGEWIVVMDCDLQDKPEEIPQLYKKAFEGYDVVLGRRVHRNDSSKKKISSGVFYAFLSYLTDTKIDSTICNFGIYRRKVIEAIKTMREELRFFPLLVRWVGFRSISIPIEHDGRAKGKSSYTFYKLFRLATDTLLAYSDKPLRITVQLGGLMSLVSFGFAIFITIRAIITNIPVMGWASLMVSLWLLSGLMIMILGIIGIYLGKTFSEVKNRPLYIISETINHD